MKRLLLGVVAALGTTGLALQEGARLEVKTFAEASPLTRNAALIERLVSPLTHAKLLAANDAQALANPPVDVEKERFGLFVPGQKPPKGYGLLVWVSPFDEIALPPGWATVLNREGIIFVMAGRSGNLMPLLGRRVPLALSARENVVRHHSIDPDRIWIGGYSGGARVAQRIALAYPDLFSGAVLDGGADAIGGADLPLPKRAQFERFGENSAVAFTTGGRDEVNSDAARRALASMRRNCIDRAWVEVRRGEGHAIMGRRSLASAIQFLDRPRLPPSADNLRCREQIYARVDQSLAQAATLVETGDRSAQEALAKIDQLYGWLASPRVVQLRAKAR